MDYLLGKMTLRSVYVAAPGIVEGRAFIMLGGDNREWFEVPAELVTVGTELPKLPTTEGSVVKIKQWDDNNLSNGNWIALLTANGWHISVDHRVKYSQENFEYRCKDYEVIYEAPN